MYMALSPSISQSAFSDLTDVTLVSEDTDEDNEEVKRSDGM